MDFNHAVFSGSLDFHGAKREPEYEHHRLLEGFDVFELRDEAKQPPGILKGQPGHCTQLRGNPCGWKRAMLEVMKPFGAMHRCGFSGTPRLAAAS